MTNIITTAHLWCNGHFISINICREFHIYIRLDQIRVEFLSYIKKRKKRKKNIFIHYKKKMTNIILITI